MLWLKHWQKKIAHYSNQKAPLHNLGNLPPGWEPMCYSMRRDVVRVEATAAAQRPENNRKLSTAAIGVCPRVLIMEISGFDVIPIFSGRKGRRWTGVRRPWRSDRWREGPDRTGWPKKAWTGGRGWSTRCWSSSSESPRRSSSPNAVSATPPPVAEKHFS